MVYIVDHTTPTPYKHTHPHTYIHTYTHIHTYIHTHAHTHAYIHLSTTPSADSHISPILLYTYFGNLPYLPITCPPSTILCTPLRPSTPLYRYSAPGSQRCSNCPAGAACPKDGFFNASLPGGGVTVCQAGCVEEREGERNARERERQGEEHTERKERGVTGCCASISTQVSTIPSHTNPSIFSPPLLHPSSQVYL